MKHLTEFKKRPEYLSGPQFDQLFNLAEYANLNREERNMYNASLKYKWDNKNVRDYEIKKGREQGLAQGLQEGEHKKAIEMAIKLKTKNTPIEEIAELTGLSIEEIQTL